MKNLYLCLLLLVTLPSFAMEFGLDRLNEPAIIEKLEGKNLAVLTHAAARNKKGEHLIDILFHSYKLKKIFAPEHGLRTMEDDFIADVIDEATGLPVISLYKSSSKSLSPADLIGIDAIVIDLQDVGVRYYTYFSTIAAIMKTCAPLGIEVVLLDRPNLLGGKIIEGQVLDPALAGKFTSYHTVPTRHGMTLGELALMINAEKKMDVKLSVIAATGWVRENLLFNLDRPWLAPSPALIELPQVGLYAIWGTLESINLAVGRGLTNELAFKVIGAPWMTTEQSIKLAFDLNQLGFKGVEFTPFSWTVTRAKYVGKVANGVKLKWDGTEVRTDEFTYKVSSLLIKLFPDQIGTDQFAVASFGSLRMVNAIRQGVPWDNYKTIIDAELTAFRLRRALFLLY
ncbi:MAG TPA: DUF1343 domain-containing protein [Bacteriovoracaceae bacterium]|nr:DUF1343 domain-containing protein [Bacteriovoracaceae bacterium]